MGKTLQCVSISEGGVLFTTISVVGFETTPCLVLHCTAFCLRERVTVVGVKYP